MVSSPDSATAAKRPSSLAYGSQLSSSLDDQLAGFAELVMSASVSGSDELRERESGGTSVILVKGAEKLTPADFGALGEDELRVPENELERWAREALARLEVQGAEAKWPEAPITEQEGSELEPFGELADERGAESDLGEFDGGESSFLSNELPASSALGAEGLVEAEVATDEGILNFEWESDEPTTQDEGDVQGLRVLVLDERVQPVVEGDYRVYQGDRSERGSFSKSGKGLATFKTIDPVQPFLFEVCDRACAIYGGAFIDPDDPAIEYGGTWFDWSLVRDNKNPDKTFWPHYRKEKDQALHGKGSQRRVDRFWQHEHIVRRPIRAIKSAGGGSQQVMIQAIPTQIRTGPIVRYTDHRRANIWIETETPSLVKLRVKPSGGKAEKAAYASTVRVGGRYFAIVEVDGLDPDTWHPYTLELAPLPAKGTIPVDAKDFDAKDFDGVFPKLTNGVRQAVGQQLAEASVEKFEWLSFRTLRPSYDKSLRFATGSCRWYPGDVIGGDEKTQRKGKDWGPDMLDKLGQWLRKTPRPQWPHFQFFGGDQIYADEIGDRHHEELVRARFASRLPGPTDPNTPVAARLIDGAWAGRFAHRLKEIKAPLPSVRNNVTSGLEKLENIYAEHPVLRLFANRRITEKQLRDQYDTARNRIGRGSQEADDERKLRMAIDLLPQLKELLAIAEPFRVYPPYWAAAERAGASNPQAYRYRSCNFLLWQLPNEEADLPTLRDQTGGDIGVRGSEARGHPSADRGRHVADFAEYAFLYEWAWTTSRDVRVLLGNVPTFLMFDDHEVTDDWNFDAAWVRMVHSERDHYRMWPKTITDALCAYWIYQGFGNKARAQWQNDPRAAALDRAQRAGIDALPELRKCIYRAVMAASPTTTEAPFQLEWHYRLPFEPPFLVPDCRSRQRLIPKDDAVRVIDHKRNPPQSETIDAEQIKWLRSALASCKHPIAFIAPSTPLLLQEQVMTIMTQPESYARAWAGETDVASVLSVAFDSTKLGIASSAMIRLFRREKDLEHMVRNKSWRDLWGLVDEMRSRRSPVKTLVLISGDVHHSYCMTGNLSGDGRPFPELLQITSSGLKTTIRSDWTKRLAAWKSAFSFDMGQRHMVPGYVSKVGGGIQKELALYWNAVAVVDVTLGADVDVRVIHLAGNDAWEVDKYIYDYTSAPAYFKAGEPAFWRREYREAVMSTSATEPDWWRNRESEGTSIIPANVPEKLTPSDLGALGREELKVLEFEVSESEVAGERWASEAQAWLESEAQGAEASPPVSPSWVSAIPNKDKDPKTLAIGIYEAEFITLEAWRSALDQFGEVMKAVSDKEGTADFAGVLQKYLENKLLASFAGVAPPVSLALGLMDGLVAENKRAKEARDAARLRDFIIRFQRSLTDARVRLSALKDDYFHLVEKNYQGGTEADKSAYKKQLVEYLDRLDKMREEGWLTGAHIFRIWAFEWIRNTTRANPNVSTRISGGPTESMVIVWVDYGDKVEKARIRAPGGQKIAEQFLKDAEGAGLRPYEWPVRRMIIYYGKNNWPLAYGKLTAQGTRDNRDRHPDDREDVADLKLNRLLALRPTTKDVRGE